MAVVDHQTHWYPPTVLDRLAGRDRYPRVRRDRDGYVLEPAAGRRQPLAARFFDLELQLADMDEHGVDVAISSPAVWLGDLSWFEPGEARELAELLNEELSRAQQVLPGRFRGLASLPLQDPEAALAVLERAAGPLGLRGVCVHSNIGGRPLAVPELLPVWRRIAELGVSVFLHPAASTAMASAYGRYGPYVEELAWMFDTSAAALGLIFGGVLDACPGLTVVHPHLGGTLPFIAGRIEGSEHFRPRVTERSALDYLRERFYVDSVTQTPGALGLGERLYGAERIVYGSDYPYIPRAPLLEFLTEELGTERSDALRSADPLTWSR